LGNLADGLTETLAENLEIRHVSRWQVYGDVQRAISRASSNDTKLVFRPMQGIEWHGKY
jgi:hypothetical protein